jgi:hypothetical protein
MTTYNVYRHLRRKTNPYLINLMRKFFKDIENNSMSIFINLFIFYKCEIKKFYNTVFKLFLSSCFAALIDILYFLLKIKEYNF